MKVFDVFISYRREDGSEMARALYQFLSERGLKVFFDTQAIVTGHRFDTQIKSSLIAATHYVLIGSRQALTPRPDEDWVMKEIQLALEHYRADLEDEDQNRTITVLVPDGTQLPEADTLPEDVRDILKFQTIFEANYKATAKETACEQAFGEILQVATAVSHANLWHGAYRWLERSKQGRFTGVKIDEQLLPNAQQLLPIHVQQGRWQKEDLVEAVTNAQSHIYLIGQGGIGKTTALLKLMNNAYEDKAYNEDNVVPLFVELSSAPDTYGLLYKGGNSSFIRRAIYRQLRPDKTLKQISAASVEELDEAFMLPYTTAVAPINTLLTKQQSSPQYLLLLDGLNEVSTVLIEEVDRTVAEMVIDEIRYLLESCPNVRLVLTSRSDELALQDEAFTRLELTGIEDETVIDYLCKKKAAPPVFSPNDPMIKTLRIPLFLILYAELSQTEHICTQGQILHTFFSRRKTNSYTMQSRLDAVANSAKDAASAVSRIRIDPDMHCFLLDFILPQIGWYMVQNGLFHLPQRILNHVIGSILENREETAVCGEFGEAVFTDYHRSSASRSNVAVVADKLLKRLGGNIRTVCGNIVVLCTFTLGVLRESDGKFSFSHQHIRDYFAAKRCINAMRLATYMHKEGETDLARSCIEEYFGGKPLDMTVERFIGEALGEHLNIPYQQDGLYFLPEKTGENRLLEDTLAIFRGHFPAGQAVAQLFGILKAVRKHLAGCDLSRLDLSACDLNDTHLCAGNLQAKLTGSLLHGDNLLHSGHASWINTVHYTDDGRYILTGGNDGKVILHNSLTGCRRQLLAVTGAVWFARMVAQHMLLSVQEKTFRNGLYGFCKEFDVRLTDLRNPHTWQQVDLSGAPDEIRISRDQKILMIHQLETLYFIQVEGLKLLQTVSISNENTSAEFYGDTHKVMLSDGSLIDAETGERTPFAQFTDIHRAAYSHDSFCLLHVQDDVLRLDVHHTDTLRHTHTILQPWRSGGRLLERALFMNHNKYLRIKYSDSGKFLAVLTPKVTFIYETEQYRLVQCLDHMNIDDVAFFDSERRMAAGTLDGQLYLFETSAFTPILCTQGIYCGITGIAASDDNRLIATVSKDEMLRIWDANTFCLVSQKQIPWDYSIIPEFSPDGTKLWYTYKNQRYIYRIPSMELLLVSEGVPQFSGKFMTVHYRNEVVVYEDDQVLYTHMLFGRDSHMAGDYLLLSLIDGTLGAFDLSTGDLCWSTMEPRKFLCANEQYMIVSDATALSLRNQSCNVYVLDSKTGEVLGHTQMENDMRTEGRLIGPYFLRRTWDTSDLYRLPSLEKEVSFIGLVTGKFQHLCAEADKNFDWLQLKIMRLQDQKLCQEFTVPVDLPTICGENSSYCLLDNHRILLRQQPDTLCMHRIHCPDEESIVPQQDILGSIQMQAGLEVFGLDLTELHPECVLTESQKNTLRIYGAKL